MLLNMAGKLNHDTEIVQLARRQNNLFGPRLNYLPEYLVLPLHVLLEVDQGLAIGLPVVIHHGVDAPDVTNCHN